MPSVSSNKFRLSTRQGINAIPIDLSLPKQTDSKPPCRLSKKITDETAEPRRWPCRFCATTWANPNGLRRHEREYHPGELQSHAESQDETFRCQQCNTPFCSKTALVTHLSRSKACVDNCYQAGRNSVRRHGNALKCRYCSCTCAAVTSLRIHERHNHADKLEAVRSLVCCYCGQRFYSQRGLTIHKTKSSGCLAKQMNKDNH